MVKKKSKRLIGIWIMVLLIIIVGGISYISNQGLTMYQEEVYIPQYLSAECVPRADNMAKLSLGEVDKKGEFFECTTKGTPGYVPIVNGIQCNYIVDISVASLGFTAYDCPISVDSESDVKDECVKLEGLLSSTNNEEYTVNPGRKFFIDPVTFFGLGEIDLKAEYPSYGLKIETADGRILSTSTNCELNSLSKEFHTIDAGSLTLVVPDAPFNVVTGLSKAYSTKLVTLEGVNNNKPVYITRPGYYYLLAEADDGWLYVATEKGEKQSSLIECIPRTTGCSDDAKFVPLVDQSCDMFGGAVGSYAPVEGDNTKLCVYDCVDGELQLSNDCIEVVADCPDDKPLWDANTGECVVVEPPKEEEGSFDFMFFIVVILIVFLSILVMLLIKIQRGRK